MSIVAKEQIRQARTTDLYDFLIRFHNNDFHRDGISIHPKNNNSLSIKQGYCGYMDFATDDRGNSLDFLVKYMNYNLADAVNALCGNRIYTPTQSKYTESRIEKMPPQFPIPIQSGYRQLYAYLMHRGISTNTIKLLIDKKIMYQDTYNNVVFVNPERTWGERRGTNTYADTRCKYRAECSCFNECAHGWCSHMDTCGQYKRDVFRGMIANSADDGFWWFQNGDEFSDESFVCESSIDAISLYELHRINGTHNGATYISIGGAGKQSAIDWLKSQDGITVIIAVDNDDAGEKCRNRNSELACIIPDQKDWNDDLLHKNADKLA